MTGTSRSGSLRANHLKAKRKKETTVSFLNDFFLDLKLNFILNILVTTGNN